MALEYPRKRDLDPVYVRVVRYEKHVDRCFSDLTIEEQKNFLNSLEKNGLKRLCLVLAESLHGLGDRLNIRVEDCENEYE